MLYFLQECRPAERALRRGGDYLRDLRVAWRCGDLMNSEARQYVWHAFMRDVSGQSATGSNVFQDGRSLDEFYAQWTSAPLADWKGRVQFVEWIDPDALPLVDKGFTRMRFVWRPESGGVTLKNQDNADLFARVDANALTFTDPNTNVTYTFERK